MNIITYLSNIFQKAYHPSRRVYRHTDSWSREQLSAPTSWQLKRLKQSIHDEWFFVRPLADYISINYKNPTYIDIGANIGNWSFAFAKYIQNLEVHCIEQNLRNLSFLANNLKSFQNIHLHHIGLDLKSTVSVPEYILDRSGKEGTSTVPSSVNDQSNNNGTYLFNATKYFAAYNFDSENISLIRVDAEILELLVLKGLKGILAQSSPILLLEINPRSMDITEFNYNDVCDYLSEYRYILLGSEQKKNIVSSRQTEFLIFVKEEKVQSFSDHYSLFNIRLSQLRG